MNIVSGIHIYKIVLRDTARLPSKEELCHQMKYSTAFL